MFEDVKHERSLTVSVSLTDPDIIKQSKFTDHEIKYIKTLVSERLHRHRLLRESFALQLLD